MTFSRRLDGHVRGLARTPDRPGPARRTTAGPGFITAALSATGGALPVASEHAAQHPLGAHVLRITHRIRTDPTGATVATIATHATRATSATGVIQAADEVSDAAGATNATQAAETGVTVTEATVGTDRGPVTAVSRPIGIYPSPGVS